MVVFDILNTVAYGLIILGLLVASINTFIVRKKYKEGPWYRFVFQFSIVVSLAGLILLIISAWVT